ncbi:MAG: hypothetical protein RLN88_03925 [Ekhidna sp.]|uniref:hypothetical protein n=1 Tax=Ekhidna sp. TaxID=2608089 RepID=UPI0032EF84F2
MKSRGLKRHTFFIVFLIPVTWYLILQLFGDNQFALNSLEPVPDGCTRYTAITVVAREDSLSVVETNYMNRVIYAAEKRKAILKYESSEYFSCINQIDTDLVLVNDEGLWGAYSLSRKGVDQLLTELDILTLQQSYGEGTTR